jgi:cysteine sulfinate desulfinase/cysteine desulfurase-like protein
MGIPPDAARCAIRVSLGWSTVAADAETFLAASRSIHARRRAAAEA